MRPILTGFILLFGMNIFHAQAFTPKRQPNLATEDIGFVETEGRPGFYVFTKDAKAIYITGSSLLRLPSELGHLITLNKFLPTQLRSGYMLDIWADGPISYPFNHLHCNYNFDNPFYSGCNIASHEPNKKPTHIDRKGFYGFSDVIRSTQYSVSPKLGQSYYYQLKNMPVGTTFAQDLNYCVYQDSNNSNRCLAQPSDASVDWQVVNHTTHKAGHMTFTSNQIDAEIIIDSNGNAVPAPGSTTCISETVNRKSGISCRITSYNIAWAGSSSPFNKHYFYGNLKTALIVNEFMALKFGSGNWNILDTAPTSIREGILSRRGKEETRLFISNRLLTQLAIYGKLKMSDLVDIYVGEWNQMSTGYIVPFTGDITVSPRAQTVSIKSADGAQHPFQEGRVGKDDLQFKYALSETGYNNANRLEVSVRQDRGSPYQGLCTFYPDNQVTQERAVPVPTALSFNTGSGAPRVLPIRCDGTPIDIRAQTIKESRPAEQWYEGGWGYTRFYEVGLNFLLTDNMVKKTVTGDMWEGATHQSGTITIKGTWN